MTKLADLSESQRWKLMVMAAKRGAAGAGYELTRLPGKGLSNVYEVERDGKKQRASIRTTRDRWIAFPPLKNGKEWKTLSGVDLVIVATVDNKDHPEWVQVFIFDASDVRARFDQAYKARTSAGNVVRDNFGMWVGLDLDRRGGVYTAGSGIVDGKEALANFRIEYLIETLGDSGIADGDVESESDEAQSPLSGQAGLAALNTIAEVKEWARQRAAEIAGVTKESVTIDLRIEY